MAKAGVLKTHAYTISLYRRFRDHLGCFNEQGFQYAPLVESDHILTAQGSAFVAFGIRLAERLDAIGDAEAVGAYYRGQGDTHWERLIDVLRCGAPGTAQGPCGACFEGQVLDTGYDSGGG